MSFELIALLCAALFAGASIYVSVVEHPARLGAGTDVALAQWRSATNAATAVSSPSTASSDCITAARR